MDFFFITGSGRCGSTLIRSLIDGNSHVDVFPKETTNFLESFYKTSGYSRYTFKNKIKLDFFDICYDVGPIVNHNNVKERLNEIERDKIYPSDLLKIISEIIYGESKKTALFDVTSPNISGYLDSFPNCKIIHVLRHPYSTLNSMYRERYSDPNSFGGAHPGNWNLKNTWPKLITTFYQAYLNNDNKNVYILKLEDLQRSPKKECEKIFDFLNVPIEKINDRQTILGENFHGNSTFKQSNKIFNQPQDWTSLTLNDKYYLSRIKHVDKWYEIENEPFSENSFMPFLKRQLGLSGKNRKKIKSIPRFIKVLLSTIGFYLQDKDLKFHMDDH